MAREIAVIQKELNEAILAGNFDQADILEGEMEEAVQAFIQVKSVPTNSIEKGQLVHINNR